MKIEIEHINKKGFINFQTIDFDGEDKSDFEEFVQETSPRAEIIWTGDNRVVVSEQYS